MNYLYIDIFRIKAYSYLHMPTDELKLLILDFLQPFFDDFS